MMISFFSPYLSERKPLGITTNADANPPMKSTRLTWKTEALRLLIKSGISGPVIFQHAATSTFMEKSKIRFLLIGNAYHFFMGSLNSVPLYSESS